MVTIGEIAEIFDGPHATPKTVDEGPIFLGIGALDNGRINLGETRHVTAEDFAIWTRRVKPRARDVVFSYETRLGQAAIIPDDFECCLGRRMGLVRARTDKVDPYFFLYSYLAPKFQAFLKSRTISGATVDRLPIKDFPNFPISVPPIGVQRSIAFLLSSIDDKIELNRRMKETLEGMAQAIFRDWFVDFGPVHRKLAGATDPIEIMGGVTTDPIRAANLSKLFPDGFDRMRPAGWRPNTVGAIAGRIATGPFGSRIKKENFVTSGVPVIRGMNLTRGFVDEGFTFLTAEKARELIGSKAEREDIVFTHRGTLGQLGRINPLSNYETYIASQSQIVLSIDRSRTSPLFMYWFLRSDEGLNAWLSNAGGAGVPSISRPTDSLKRIEFLDPGSALAFEFDSLARVLEARGAALDKETVTLAETRDYLLPRLMSGEVRLGDVAKEIAA